MSRPLENEHIPYFSKYINLVPDGKITNLLEQQLEPTLNFLKEIPEEKTYFRYAEGKWSVKEVLGHMIDVERILSYRALRFSRKDENHLPGFEQDDYVAAANFDKVNWTDLIDEFYHVRKATIHMFKKINDEDMKRTGTANGNLISVRALAYILVGHVTHHSNLIKERYLVVEKTNA